MIRRLQSTRRHVPLDRLEEYDALWARLRDAVQHAGGHAWRFRGARREDRYIEFIESPEVDAILASAAVIDARDALDGAFGAGTAEEWEESTP